MNNSSYGHFGRSWAFDIIFATFFRIPPSSFQNIYYKFFFPVMFSTFILHMLRDTIHSNILHIITPIRYSIRVLNFMLPARTTNFIETPGSHESFRRIGTIVIMCITKNITLCQQRAFICLLFIFISFENFRPNSH